MKKEKKYVADFWERESMADSMRRKSLDSLDYVVIPFDALPMELLANLPEVEECHHKLRELSEKKIVNFSGYSNTDLKLAYGAPNIDRLSEYDANFEELITLLQNWASLLLQSEKEAATLCPKEDRKNAAKTILAYAVSVGSDIFASYEQLVKLYLEYGEQDKIPALKQKAETLRSLSKRKILTLIEEAEKSV